MKLKSSSRLILLIAALVLWLTPVQTMAPSISSVHPVFLGTPWKAAPHMERTRIGDPGGSGGYNHGG